ncbi:MAG: hypothetical protein JKX94_05890 [Sneathiella sp.]|nr:hypothetical protein [Sneathiella sp.]
MAGVILFEFALGYPFSYIIATPFRKVISPEYYDDTYLKTARWPQPDSNPYKATVKFEYKSHAYSVDRIVRCYQDLGKTFVHGPGRYIWYSHLKLFVVPLHDGGTFIADIPNDFCDTYTGITQSQPLDRQANGFTYLDNGLSPTYLETYFFRADTTHNVAVAGDKYAIDPKQVHVSATHLNETNFEYSPNRQSLFYSQYHRPGYGNYFPKPTGKTIYLTGLRTTVLFKAQWSKNAQLVEFLADKTEPTLVPKKLLPGSHTRIKPSKELERQVREFFQKKEYSIEDLDPGKRFYVFMNLTGRHEWQLDYSQLGGFRYFRRGCDLEFKNCQFQDNIRDFLKEDFVKIGSWTEKLSNISGIYLPNEQVILSHPAHETSPFDTR